MAIPTTPGFVPPRPAVGPSQAQTAGMASVNAPTLLKQAGQGSNFPRTNAGLSSWRNTPQGSEGTRQEMASILQSLPKA